MTSRLPSENFRPVNDAHAILEAAIFCEFEPQLTPDQIKSLSDLKLVLQNELPDFDTRREMQFSARKRDDGTTEQRMSEEVVGIQLRKFSGSDGHKLDKKQEWVLLSHRENVSVHCTEYVRWAQFVETGLKYLSAFFKMIPPGSRLKTVVVKYVDRFVFEGPQSAYDPAGLFNSRTKYLAMCNLQTKDPRWHNHVGWFQDLGDKEFEILSQLNVDTGYDGLPGARIHITTIDNTLVLQRREEHPKSSLGLPIEPGSADTKKFLFIINELHTLNKKIMTDLLTSDMCNRMNLRV